MSELLTGSISATATASFQQLLWVSVIGGSIVLVALLIHGLFSQRVRPGWIYLIWLVITARFLLLVVPASPLSFLNLFAQTSHQRQLPPVEIWPPLYRTTAPAFDALPSHTAPVAATQIESFVVAPSNWQAIGWLALAIVWLTVLLVLVVRLLRGMARVRQVVSRSSEPPLELARRFLDLCDKTETRHNVSLKVTRDIDAPASAGIFKPVILMPAWCLEELEPQQQDIVLVHELTHVQRRDNLLQLLSHLASIIHWFNPLVWLASRLADQYRELSCDRRVLDLLGSKRNYQRTIAQVAIRAADTDHFEPALAGAFVNSNSKLVKKRIAMLSKRNSHPRLGGLAVAVILVSLVAVGFTDAQTEELKPKESTPKPIPTDSTPPEKVIIPGPRGYYKAPVLAHGPIVLTVGQATVVPATCELTGATFDDPEIASATVKQSKLEILAVEPGRTVAHIELPGNRIQPKKIIALPDVGELQSAISEEFPQLVTSIYGTPDGNAVIAGFIKKELAAKVMAFAKTKTDLPIRDLTTDKQHVSIKVWVYKFDLAKFE